MVNEGNGLPSMGGFFQAKDWTLDRIREFFTTKAGDPWKVGRLGSGKGMRRQNPELYYEDFFF